MSNDDDAAREALERYLQTVESMRPDEVLQERINALRAQVGIAKYNRWIEESK